MSVTDALVYHYLAGGELSRGASGTGPALIRRKDKSGKTADNLDQGTRQPSGSRPDGLTPQKGEQN